MISGGGVLAHTILGVDWDEAGNIAFMAATTMTKILEMNGNNEGN